LSYSRKRGLKGLLARLLYPSAAGGGALASPRSTFYLAVSNTLADILYKEKGPNPGYFLSFF